MSEIPRKYVSIASIEEVMVDTYEPSANEVVHKMWHKLDDTEKALINILIETYNNCDKVIEFIKTEPLKKGTEAYRIGILEILERVNEK